jgi:hypothetical protein
MKQGRNGAQGPSESDRRWHMRQKLRGFVISQENIFAIDTSSDVSVVGKRDEVLSQ